MDTLYNNRFKQTVLAEAIKEREDAINKQVNLIVLTLQGATTRKNGMLRLSKAIEYNNNDDEYQNDSLDLPFLQMQD